MNEKLKARALYLYVVQEYSYRAIAEELDLSYIDVNDLLRNIVVVDERIGKEEAIGLLKYNTANSVINIIFSRGIKK